MLVPTFEDRRVSRDQRSGSPRLYFFIGRWYSYLKGNTPTVPYGLLRESFISLYVDYICTLQETYLRASTASCGDSITLLAQSCFKLREEKCNDLPDICSSLISNRNRMLPCSYAVFHAITDVTYDKTPAFKLYQYCVTEKLVKLKIDVRPVWGTAHDTVSICNHGHTFTFCINNLSAMKRELDMICYFTVFHVCGIQCIMHKIVFVLYNSRNYIMFWIL
jgi:hypothetical protein